MIPLSKDCPLAKQIFFLYLNLTKIIIQKKKKKKSYKGCSGLFKESHSLVTHVKENCDLCSTVCLGCKGSFKNRVELIQHLQKCEIKSIKLAYDN